MKAFRAESIKNQSRDKIVIFVAEKIVEANY